MRIIHIDMSSHFLAVFPLDWCLDCRCVCVCPCQCPRMCRTCRYVSVENGVIFRSIPFILIHILGVTWVCAYEKMRCATEIAQKACSSPHESAWKVYQWYSVLVAGYLCVCVPVSHVASVCGLHSNEQNIDNESYKLCHIIIIRMYFVI